jgi:hypothetical protein
MLGLLLFNFLGCADYSMVGIKQRDAEILVHPLSLDFGNLESGVESEQRYFTVVNTGDADLIITSPVLISEGERFLLGTETSEDITITAGGLVQFDISYTPLTYEFNEGYIEFETSDSNSPTVQIAIQGQGDAPVMAISPIDFDYGDVTIGCDNEERVTVTNDGNMPLVIDSVVQMVTQPVDILFELGSLPELPWTIDPGESFDFLVSYIPNDIGTDESEITVEGNDPYTPIVETRQYGAGDVELWHEETHIQEEVSVLDILWVVDDSGSMSRFQSNLSSNIGSFVTAFVAAGADYRMAVITTSDSQIGHIIDTNTALPSGAIALEVLVGVHGHGMEKGLEMSYLALSNSGSAGPGGSFFRTDASLIVIYVSDEPDFSPGVWSDYVTFFDQLKPSGNFVPLAVIGDHPGGCSLGSTSAQYGAGYWDLVNYYGGSWYSICAQDWGAQLQAIGSQIAGMRSYMLDHSDPIVETITVLVNGQLVSEWTYNQTTNEVIFNDGFIPDEGQTIEISYAEWGCYE